MAVFRIGTFFFARAFSCAHKRTNAGGHFPNTENTCAHFFRRCVFLAHGIGGGVCAFSLGTVYCVHIAKKRRRLSFGAERSLWQRNPKKKNEDRSSESVLVRNKEAWKKLCVANVLFPKQTLPPTKRFCRLRTTIPRLISTRCGITIHPTTRNWRRWSLPYRPVTTRSPFWISSTGCGNTDPCARHPVATIKKRVLHALSDGPSGGKRQCNILAFHGRAIRGIVCAR